MLKSFAPPLYSSFLGYYLLSRAAALVKNTLMYCNNFCFDDEAEGGGLNFGDYAIIPAKFRHMFSTVTPKDTENLIAATYSRVAERLLFFQHSTS